MSPGRRGLFLVHSGARRQIDGGSPVSAAEQQVPAITLPKGGGAIRGIGEKFAAEPVSGTGSMSVPVAASPGRSGFGPQPSLAYDSGAGNGPFGFGWGLSAPAITRKTDQGLPRYLDGEESDVFLLSGAEDLVPELDEDGVRVVREVDGYRVHPYRPRIEGLSARIERWTAIGRPADVHWRSLSSDNVLTLYGVDASARVTDPDDPRRTFSWQISETRDDKGDAIVYGYRKDQVTTYLKTIRYGNLVPLLTAAGDRPLFLTAEQAGTAGWCFELVFDYGDHAAENPSPQPDRPWPRRLDAFSTHRPGFAVRTSRLCRRVLMFHHFPEEPGVGADCLVRSTDLTYRETPVASYLTAVTHSGYRDGLRRSMPAVEFTYSEAVLDGTVHEAGPATLENLPSGVDGETYRWVDLDSEGLAGVLSEQAGAWFYKPNNGDGELGPQRLVTAMPATGGRQFLDLAGDGPVDLVDFGGPVPGFSERAGEGWEPLRPFRSLPALAWDDPALRFVDLDGDGHADVLLTGRDTLTWHRSLGEDGFGEAVRVSLPHDEDRGTEPLHLADMCGDGLDDLVRVRNGDVCYWPSLGHGRFGAKVTMGNAPLFDPPGQFDPRRLRLADIDGSGTVDLIYLGRDGVRLYFNQSGNSFSDPSTLAVFPAGGEVDVTDLLGNGTACLVWSSPLPHDAGRQLRYVDLMGGQKPHLLVGMKNNLGAETRLSYAPSTHSYLRDREAGRPWVTRLPFPVHVLERVESYDHISRNTSVSRYEYHDGYFDGVEREFRGFGQVDQWDEDSHGPPVRTRTWFHTGAADGLPGDPELPPRLTPSEYREAYRALKGTMLRQEVYAEDGSERAGTPYVVTEQSLAVRMLQPAYGNRHAVFASHVREAISHQYERDIADPRISQTLTLAVDPFGNVLRQVSIAYGRATAAAVDEAQARTLITTTENSFTEPVTGAGDHRTPLPAETRVYELTGYPAAQRFGPDDFAATVAEIDYAATPTTGRQRRLIEQVRTVYRKDDLTGLLALGVAGTRALPGETYRLAFTQLLLQTVLPEAPGADAGYVDLDGDGRRWIPGGRVFHSPGVTDTPGQELARAREHFFLANRYRDPFGNTSTVTFDRYDLLLRETRDPVGNQVTIGERGSAAPGNDYRVLQPVAVMDPNRNRAQTAYDALGLVTGTAVLGQPEEDLGDTLAGFDADLTETVALAHLADPLADPGAVLQGAGTRLIYDLFAFQRDGSPAVAYSLGRETHGPQTAFQHAFAYSDGFGREIQTKARAESADGDPAPRWTGSGWTIFSSKGKPVRTYEPFFTGTHRFEFEVLNGVSPVLFYDPLGRVVATLHPHDAYEKTVLGPWGLTTFDVNDTVVMDPRTDPDIGGYVAQHFASVPAGWQTWREQRIGGALGAEEQKAAEKATVHADTPSTVHTDPLGRSFLTVTRNRFIRDGATVEQEYRTRIELDIEGNPRAVRDPLGRTIMTYDYDMLGNRVYQAGVDAGQRWTLTAADGKPVRSWDDRGQSFRTEYDAARRPVRNFSTGSDGVELLTERVVYGEQHPDNATGNLRGRVCLQCDQAGVIATEHFDFKGNPLSSVRRITTDYRDATNWNAVDAALPGAAVFDPVTLEAALSTLVEDETFTTTTGYDALNRPVVTTMPDASVIRSGYNVASLLDRVDVNLQGVSGGAGEPVWTTYVSDIDYDAQGRRASVVLGNEVTTTYAYDPLTFRLARMTTGDVQDLRYTFDPAGNITHVTDAAQQTVFFRNTRVEPSAQYTYDAMYRLVEATGREHLGQAGTPVPYGSDDAARSGVLHPNDGPAMGTYVESYHYDAVGNLELLKHTGSDPANAGWQRAYAYEQGRNRLATTQLNGVNAPVERYEHDEHGNLTRLPHLDGLHWDFQDRLRQVDLAGGGTAYYVYDSAGQRVRKVWEKAPGLVEERIYLGGYEVFRRRDGNGAVQFARETLHVSTDDARIALVETRTVDLAGTDRGPRQLSRYQLANHLGSTSVELDSLGRLLSYEEYTPYGSTAYQAMSGQTESPKRYRYTGKERDEETGFSYHGARYYAPWLGRWTAADPAELSVDLSMYVYCRGNPVVFHDLSGRAPAQPVGYIYHLVFPIDGVDNHYVGSAVDIQARLGPKHSWAELIQHPDTKITAYEVRAKLNVGASGQGTSLSAQLEALRSQEQKVLNQVADQIAKQNARQKPGQPLGAILNKIMAASEPEVFQQRHAATLGRSQVIKKAGQAFEAPSLPGRRLAGTLRVLGTAATVLSAASELYAPVAAAAEIDAAGEQLGSSVGVPMARLNQKLLDSGLVTIGNTVDGQTFMFDPKTYGPAPLYRIVGNPVEAAELGIAPGSLQKVADFWNVGDRWYSPDMTAIRPLGLTDWYWGRRESQGWIDKYPDNALYLNMKKD